MRQAALVALALVLVALGLRISFYVPPAWHGYDERIYARYTDALSAGTASYRGLFKEYPVDPSLAFGSPPTRIAFVAVAALPCALFARCGATAVQDVAFVSGALLAALAYLVLRRWLDERSAIVSGVLVALSPLGLALSFRGLQDTFFALMVLGFIGAHDHYWRRPSTTAAAAVGLGAVLALLTKESASPVVAVQALVAAAYYRWQHPKVSPLPLLVALAGAVAATTLLLTLLAGDFETLHQTYAFYLKTVPIIPYSLDRQGGPWFRYAVDFMLLSPMTLMLAIYAVGRSRWSALTATLVLGFAVFAFLPIINARFVLWYDVLLRGAAVAGVTWLWKERGAHVAVPVLVLLLVSDLVQFERLFREGGVYDPVTFDLAKALGFFRT